MSKTRSSAEVWLMEKGTEELSGPHLSTNADAIRLLLFFHVHGTRHRWWTKILLRMPKIGRGTGKEQAKACLNTMNGVSRIEFNTPASNTGLKNGACTFIARISLGGLPPTCHGTFTSCCFQLLSWVHWSVLFCLVQEVPANLAK